MYFALKSLLQKEYRIQRAIVTNSSWQTQKETKWKSKTNKKINSYCFWKLCSSRKAIFPIHSQHFSRDLYVRRVMTTEGREWFVSEVGIIISDNNIVYLENSNLFHVSLELVSEFNSMVEYNINIKISSTSIN